MSESDSAPDFAAQNQVTALLRERKDVLTVRWLAATAAIGALAIVLALIAQTIPAELPTAVVVVAWLIGGALAAASVLAPRQMMGQKLIAARLRAPVDAYRCAVQMKLSAANKDVFIALPVSEQSVCALTLMFERPYTIALGLAFGVALVGFVYGLVSQTLLEAAPFLLTALGLMCWHYPRLDGLVDRGRAVLKADQEQEALRALEDIQQRQQQQEKHEQEVAPRPQRKSRTGERPPGTGTQKP
jgi:cobalamin synthase